MGKQYEIKDVETISELRALIRKKGTKLRGWVTYTPGGNELMVELKKTDVINRLKGVEPERKVKATYGTGGYVIIG